MTLQELAELVEGAKGPSRELDALVALACGIVKERDGDCFYGHRDHSLLVLERGYYDHDGNAPELPHYTASLDAAMTLVPKGATFTVDEGPSHWIILGKEKPAGRAMIHSLNPDRDEATGMNVDLTEHGFAATPALALCAAALRAIARATAPAPETGENPA